MKDDIRNMSDDELLAQINAHDPYDVEFARRFTALRARVAELEAERERLALAICGGEDAPGYANAQHVEVLEKLARQNADAHMHDIDRLIAAEARVAALEAKLSGGVLSRQDADALMKRLAALEVEAQAMEETRNAMLIALERRLLLPPGVVWVGFDENGKSVAASIERKKPSGRRHCVMEGCAVVVKCKTPPDGKLFGRMRDEFEAAP